MIISYIPAILIVPSLQLIIPLIILFCFGLLCGTKLMFN